MEVWGSWAALRSSGQDAGGGWGCSRDRCPYGVQVEVEGDYIRRGILWWILCTNRQTDAKQCNNRKITTTPSGRTTRYSPCSSCTGRCRAVATAYRPAQPMKLRSSDGETTVCLSEQEKWDRERSNFACLILVLSYPMLELPRARINGNLLDSVCATAASRSESSAARLANARVIYFRKAVPVDSNSFSTRCFLWGYAFKNWCNSVMPSLCIAPVVSLEI